MREWHPWIAKHAAAVPLTNVLTALGLDSFEENGVLWVQDIGKVGNAYYVFEHEGNTYDQFVIPMPNNWAVVREHLPGDWQMDRLVGKLEHAGALRYDVHMRHVAPLSAIREVLGVAQPSPPAPRKTRRKSKLDGRENEIRRLLEKGDSKAAIARALKVSKSTLYRFLKRRLRRIA